MPSATSVTKNPTNSQPRVMTAGPPMFMANPKSVRHPDRIEMMVNETAKFENVFIPRRSSWAYPSWWSLSVSFDADGSAAIPETLLHVDDDKVAVARGRG